MTRHRFNTYANDLLSLSLNC